jgi:hypothetical protein
MLPHGDHWNEHERAVVSHVPPFGQPALTQPFVGV